MPTSPRHQAGFTLIELLIVVMIIGILATIAIPVMGAQRKKANNAAPQAAVRSAVDAAAAIYTDGDSYANINSVTLPAMESSISGTSTFAVANSTPGNNAANPTTVLISNYGASPVSGGASPTATDITFCAVGKGDYWYCAHGTTGTWVYKKGTGAMNPAADTTIDSSGHFGALTNW